MQGGDTEAAHRVVDCLIQARVERERASGASAFDA
jgi:hypothetical protein